MQKFHKNIALFLCLFFAITIQSCQEEIVVPLNDDITRLVIEGTLERRQGEPDSAFQSISLTLSSQFYDRTSPRPVTNAQVSVSSSDGTQNEILRYNSRTQQYETASLPIRANIDYITTIIWQGDTLTSSGRLVPGGSIDTLYYREQRETVFAPGGIIAIIDFSDPVQYNNYYQLRLLRNGKNTITTDPGNRFTLLRNDEFFNGRTLRGIPVNDEVVFKVGDTITVEVISFDKEMFDYYFTAYDINQQGGFDPPPAPLRSNVENISSTERFALGFLGVADLRRRSVVVR